MGNNLNSPCNEFRAFKEITSEFPTKKLEKYKEKRHDLYIIFPKLTKEFQNSFGLKFRDVKLLEFSNSFIKIEVKKIELKQRVYFKNNIEGWIKIIQLLLSKKYEFVFNPNFERNNNNVSFTNFREIYKIIINELQNQANFELFKNELEKNEFELKFGLLEKKRKKKSYFYGSIEKCIIKLIILEENNDKERFFKYYKTYCLENFSEDKIEEIKNFEKKYKKMKKKFDEKMFVGYPEFISTHL